MKPIKLGDTDLSLPDRVMVESVLLHGENLLWAGKPVPRLSAGGGASTLKFSVVWLVLLSFWTWGAWQSSMAFACFSIPFWLIGLGMFSLPWFGLRRQKRTVLLVTDRRAMELYPSFLGELQTKVWPLEPGLVRACTVRKDGSGDLILGYETRHSKNGTHTVEQGFMNVPDVRRVEQFLYDLTQEQ